jgi:V8-like Glu-specific endopeptidase
MILRKIASISFVCSSFLLLSGFAGKDLSLSAPKKNSLRFLAVFGEDNRQDLYNANSKWQEIGHSIAGKVSLDHMQGLGSDWKLSGSPLSAKECAGTKFADQITVPSCTGFLVKPTILITAAHCINSEDDCTNFKWVFEYALHNGHESPASYTKVSQNQVYKCKKILARRYENFGNVDYAILELDRPVLDRKPLPLGFDLPLVAGQSMTDIGHSSGLPLKFKDSGKILRITPDGLGVDTDLDIFKGDSGSPIFDENTGLVVGITSHGHTDHYHKAGESCRSVKVCKPEDGCYPSTFSRITNIQADPVFKSLFN